MNQKEMRTETSELIRLATQMYSDNPETLVRLFSKICIVGNQGPVFADNLNCALRQIALAHAR